MAKHNVRSMRLSDAVIDMIESQAGDSFTAKFDALVTRCMFELPQKEKQLEHIQSLIRNETARLDRIRNVVSVLESNLDRYYSDMRYYLKQSNQAVVLIDRLIKDM